MSATDVRKRSYPYTPPWERKAKDHRRTNDQRSPNHRSHNHAAPETFSREQILRNQMQEAEQMREWVAKEDDFVLKQSKKKAKIRVQEGRAKPIDWLAVTLRAIDNTQDSIEDDSDEEEADIIDPAGFVETLDLSQSQDLKKDIDSYFSLEKDPKNRGYWNALKTVCEHHVAKVASTTGQPRTHSLISKDIEKLLGPKSLADLLSLEKQISIKLQSDEAIDFEYWENLLRNVGLFKAKAELKAIYQSIIQQRLHTFQKEQRREVDNLKARLQPLVSGACDIIQDPTSDEPTIEGRDSVQLVIETDESLDPEPELRLSTEHKALSILEEKSFLDRYSMERDRIHNLGYIPAKQAPAAKGMNSSLDGSRTSIKSHSRLPIVSREDVSSTTNALYEREVARGVQEDEEIFAGEEEVTTTSRPQWASKYRPRKPRYFNRVQMGYEWNKYNQTHYDHENPPPKVVQGYKFNIFYPDLIDRTKAPTYRIEREGGRKRGEMFAPAGEEDTCLIRFVSGPPYEDIAFRIVDKEWDFSAKRERGFKSSYDKGILQLHFQFKKIYYRK